MILPPKGHERGGNILKSPGMFDFRLPPWLSDMNTDWPSNECKRRKLKCSGGETCTRCMRDQIECVYPISRPAGQARETEVKDNRYVVSRETQG